MPDFVPYNPLEKKNLAASVAEALLERRVHPLGEMLWFLGAGIYAIYYTGDFPAYAALAERNRNNDFCAPIYVGKAVPPGARRGLDVSPGRALSARLAQHAESIRAVTNLNIADFHCRFLVVDDIWIPLGESLLITKFAPVWNAWLDGFGNHDPGRGRYQGLRPRWDVLHPGRAWANRCQQRDETPELLETKVISYLTNVPATEVITFHDNGTS